MSPLLCRPRSLTGYVSRTPPSTFSADCTCPSLATPQCAVKGWMSLSNSGGSTHTVFFLFGLSFFNLSLDSVTFKWVLGKEHTSYKTHWHTINPIILQWLYLCIWSHYYWCIKYLWSPYYLPGTTVGTGTTAAKRCHLKERRVYVVETSNNKQMHTQYGGRW